MAKDWIQTHEGRALYPMDLKPEQVGSIDEIAHALSMKCRFTGQSPCFYSVAQHCVIGSRLLPPHLAGAFLLHELSEVYLPDIASPLKPFVLVELPEGGNMYWHELEHHHTSVILGALGLSSMKPLIYSPEVKAMDLAMLAAEKRDLFPTEAQPWGLDVAPAATTIYAETPHEAKTRFLQRYAELFR